MRSVGDPIRELIGRLCGIIGTLQHPLFFYFIKCLNIELMYFWEQI